MNISQQGLGGREFMIATLAVLVLANCGTTKDQGQLSRVESHPTTQLVQRNARQRSVATPSPSRHLASHHLRSADKANAASSTENLHTDTTVLSQIHQANLTEIALGELAETKASAPEVRAYADQLVHDHQSVDGTVLAMAQKKGTSLRDQAASSRQGPKGAHSARQSVQKLMAASGSTFDQLFLKQVDSDHQRLIQRLQQDREDANDDDIEGLIDKILPILEQHRELAQILMKKERA